MSAQDYAHHHFSLHNHDKLEASLLRTIERYQGKLSLIATWSECVKPSHPYLKKLNHDLTKLRSQLKVKGVYLDLHEGAFEKERTTKECNARTHT